MSLLMTLPDDWRVVLQAELEQDYLRQLEAFLTNERESGLVFPPPEDVFNALSLTPYNRVNVVILGQDPYHDQGQAHGLAFSVRSTVKFPPSLRNIFKELASDLGVTPPRHGSLEAWARQGVLLLNTVLTVRAHTPTSHQGKGWERFTDAIIRAISDRPEPVIFVLWGGQAQKKLGLIDQSRHQVLQSAHPSPLSANNGFFGSRPFSRINTALAAAGRPAIDWRLDEV